MIELVEVSKSYQGRRVLGPVTLHITQGEILVVLGPSGCGKTTLLRLITGLERPDSGCIRIAGRSASCTQRELYVPPERRGVGMVFQDGALFPHLTAHENVAFGLRPHATGRSRRVRELLDLVGLAGVEKRYPHELSGGEQQRVALARSLAPQPRVLLLDEPLNNLDAALRPRMREDLKAIVKTLGTTTVFVTHDQEEAAALADRIAVLCAGQLEQVGTPEEVYRQPASRLVAEFLGRGDFLPGAVRAGFVETELGRFPAPRALADGMRVDVLVGIEELSLHICTTGSAGQITAEVRERQFRGTDVLYKLQLPSGRVVRSAQSHGPTLDVGARVFVRRRTDLAEDSLVFCNGRQCSGQRQIAGQALGTSR